MERTYDLLKPDGVVRWKFAVAGHGYALTRLKGLVRTTLPAGASWCILACMGKLRMNIYLTVKQKASMEKLSAKTGAPVAELVRRAIDSYLVLRKKELK